MYRKNKIVQCHFEFVWGGSVTSMRIMYQAELGFLGVEAVI